MGYPRCLLFAGRYLAETLRGKDLNRTLGNFSIEGWRITGRVIDVGGGAGASSYRRFLSATDAEFTTLDGFSSAGVDLVANLDKEPIPVASASFDFALVFNVLEHLAEPEQALREVRRSLRPNGQVLGIVPFLVNVHPDPNDYRRFTDQGLKKMLSESGFSEIEIFAIGAGPFSAGYYQIEFILPRALRLLMGPLVLAADWLLGRVARANLKDRFPLSYRFSARNS